MPDQKVKVHLNVPMNPRDISERLQEAGFEVEALWEVRGGGVFNATSIVTFVVEHLDDTVIGVLAGVIANIISKGPARHSIGDRGVGVTMKDSESSVIINVTGDGNWIQVEPRSERSAGDEEE